MHIYTLKKKKKHQHTKSHSQTLTLDCGTEMAAQRGLESYKERMSCVNLGRELEDQLQIFLVHSPSPTPPTGTIFPGSNATFLVVSE